MHKIIIQFCNFIFGKHKNNTLPRIWILAADMVLVIFAYIMASFLLAIDYFPNVVINWKISWLVPLCYLISFLITKTSKK